MPSVDEQPHRLPDTVRMAALCKTLSTVVRIRILGMLVEVPEANATLLADVLAESKDTINNSVNALSRAGLIEQIPLDPRSVSRARWWVITEPGIRAYQACQQMVQITNPHRRSSDGKDAGGPTKGAPRSRAVDTAQARLPAGMSVPEPPAHSPEWFANAWLSLTPSQRVVINWRCTTTMSQAAIAQRLGVSREAARRLEWQALTALSRARPRMISSIADGHTLLGPWLPPRHPGA